LKEDLSEAEKWIGKEQESIQKNISNVEKAVSDTRKTLEGTGTFTGPEIESQLEGIKNKKTVL